MVVVFLGGVSGSRDLSLETGYWVCHYLPRTRYQVVPIHVTAQNEWQVPTGALPAQGPVRRMLDMLWQSLRAVSPREGLVRLLEKPVSAMLTVLRGPGGDDGSLHDLGLMSGVSVVGSSPALCQQTADKHTCQHLVGKTISTPRSVVWRANSEVQSVVEEARKLFIPPFYVKPVHQEGSFGIERIQSTDEFTAAVQQALPLGDLMIQEEVRGQEISVTMFDDEETGKVNLLPPTFINPIKATFYDHWAKRRPGRVDLRQPDSSRQTGAVMEAARQIYEEWNLSGPVTFDMKMSGEVPSLLEINTVPVLHPQSVLWQQLQDAHIHPSLWLKRVVDKALAMDPKLARAAAGV
jgi:D-alanine-D-alanine ligase